MQRGSDCCRVLYRLHGDLHGLTYDLWAVRGDRDAGDAVLGLFWRSLELAFWARLMGFLQGAWPFGIIEGIWAVVAFRRYWRSGR